MKHLKYLAAAVLSMIVISSCSKDRTKQEAIQVSVNTISGSWHMTSWSDLTSADIYVTFNPDGTYDLYQRLYSPLYEHFTGLWRLDGNILSGDYDTDGIPWRTEYDVALSASGEEMTLTATGNADDKATYVKAEVPDEILSGDLSLKSSGESESHGFRFL